MSVAAGPASVPHSHGTHRVTFLAEPGRLPPRWPQVVPKLQECLTTVLLRMGAVEAPLQVPLFFFTLVKLAFSRRGTDASRFCVSAPVPMRARRSAMTGAAAGGGVGAPSHQRAVHQHALRPPAAAHAARNGSSPGRQHPGVPLRPCPKIMYAGTQNYHGTLVQPARRVTAVCAYDFYL